jgi:S-formylglutathione hydrolase FrmB
MIEFQTTYYSSAVGLQLGARILVPESGPSGKSTLYLLHGLSDDHSIWHRRSSVERYVEPCDAVVVMPYGGRGFYTNADQGARWGDALGTELIAKVEDWFGVATSSERRHIAGLSMGGYGAFRLALSNPGVYGHAASMSGVLMIGSQPLNHPLRCPEYDEELLRIFSENPIGTNHDLLHLVAKGIATGQLPKLWMDCGRSDFLFEDNQTFFAKLQEMKAAVRYEVTDGSHDWQYWNRLLPNVLQWMGLTPAA